MVPDIIKLQLDTYMLLSLLGASEGALRAVNGLEQELQDRLQTTLVSPGCSPIPSCYRAGRSSAVGYTLWLGMHYDNWAHVISALPAPTTHGQDLIRGSFLLAPLKCHYRNQNSQGAAKLFPFGCAPDQTSSKNASCALSKHQEAPSSHPAPSPGPVSLLKGPGGHQEGQQAGVCGCPTPSGTGRRGAAGTKTVFQSPVSELSFTGVRAELFIGWHRARLAGLQPGAAASMLLSLRKHGFRGVL